MASAQSDVDWQSTKHSVLERTRHMFNNSVMSNISFTCEGSHKIFYAHKHVLGTSSAVFQAMFYGPLAEKDSVLHLSDTDEKGLEEFLRFLYTDECNSTPDTVVSVLYLSKKYIVPSLTEYLKAMLVRDMEPGNVMNVLEQAVKFEEKDLEMKCWQVIEWRASEVLASESFNNISQETLASLLKRNNLNTSEVQLFEAVLKWIDFNCSKKNLDPTRENRRSVIGNAIYELRFLGMSKEEFAKHVSKSGLISAEELVPIYEKLFNLESSSLRWILPAREKTFNATKEKIRISRFAKEDHTSPWPHSGSTYDQTSYRNDRRRENDSLSFSVDQYALFLGVRLFGCESVPNRDYNYRVNLEINGRTTTGSCNLKSRTTEDGIPGFDVMLESPILVKENEVVKMEARIWGPVSHFGWRGKATVKVKGITVTFIDSGANNRTCVSRGQFHQIILSV